MNKDTKLKKCWIWIDKDMLLLDLIIIGCFIVIMLTKIFGNVWNTTG